MDQNPAANLKSGESSGSSQLFGGNFKKDNLEKRVAELMRESTEYHELREYIINKGINRIRSEGVSGRYGAAIPAIIGVVLSYFIDVSYVPFLGKVAENFARWLFPASTLFEQKVEPITLWWLPFLTFGIFMLCAELSYRKLMNEVSTKGVSQEIIERITTRYATIVDGIGTALPLLGAAILLISIKEGAGMFLGFSVPFEIKAITILAIAKLFESVFDSQGLKFAELREELNVLEKEYFSERDDVHQRAILQQLHDGFNRRSGETAAGLEKFSKQEADEIFNSLKRASEFSEHISKNVVIMKNAIVEMSKTNVHDSELLRELQNTSQSLTVALAAATQTAEYSEIMKKNLESMRNLMVELGNIKYPDESVLKELQITAHMLTETANSLKDAQAIKGLDNLAYLAGKR
jgi:methyl-accepting chemotaxis protein